MALKALFGIALFNAMILSSVFHNVGGGRFIFDPLHPEETVQHDQRVRNNFIGVVFFAATDQFITCSMGQTLQMPILKPIYTREIANKMYYPTSYFLTGWLVSTISLLFYPLIISSIGFQFIGFDNTSSTNFFDWMCVMLILAVSGSSFGFMFGCIFNDDQ